MLGWAGAGLLLPAPGTSGAHCGRSFWPTCMVITQRKPQPLPVLVTPASWVAMETGGGGEVASAFLQQKEFGKSPVLPACGAQAQLLTKGLCGASAPCR